MKASLKWIKDYVRVNANPEELARVLTMSGLHVASVGKSGSDWVLEFEITSNRSDCLCILGISREIAAITGGTLNAPKELLSAGGSGKKRRPVSLPAGTGIKVRVDDRDLCPRYTARVIRGVRVGGASLFIRERLESVGLRPVNNIVDITNFLLMETGQPMHAFDLDKINGEAVIRKAKKGETIKIIDGALVTLEAGMLVIADSGGPIAVAGVMGGADTEVDAGTKNILLESAFFDPVSVRRTSRKLGLSTESSYRFERRVDMGMIACASKRAAAMICLAAGGTAGETIDIGGKEDAPKEIVFNIGRTADVLGMDIPAARQKKILKTLGFGIKGNGPVLKVTAPRPRKDINQEVDVIEEIVRVFGYDRIPETLPGIIGNTVLMDTEGVVRDHAREALVSMGFEEIISYNLISEEAAGFFNTDREKEVRLINPLSKELEIMSETLIAGMLKCMSWNINRKNTSLKLFETGKVYKRVGSGYSEAASLCVGMTGAAHDDWVSGTRQTTFFDLKGVLEALFAKLGVRDVKFKPASDPLFSACASVTCRGRKLGIAGKPGSRIMKYIDLSADVFVAELYMDEITGLAVTEKRFEAIPKYPSVFRDISMVAAADTPAGDVAGCVREAAGGIARKVELADVYKGEQIPEGKAGFLYRVEYMDPAATLTDRVVDEAHNRARDALKARFGVVFR
ncbi:MAG: phenylalanine--tRNA ligase subunit beta [Candidatus Omnitrophota bacterium]